MNEEDVVFNVLRGHFDHYFEGVQLRLKHELDIEIEDIVLVKVLLELESESNLSKMQFTSQTPEAIIDLIKENLELIEKYKKNV